MWEPRDRKSRDVTASTSDRLGGIRASGPWRRCRVRSPGSWGGRWGLPGVTVGTPPELSGLWLLWGTSCRFTDRQRQELQWRRLLLRSPCQPSQGSWTAGRTGPAPPHTLTPSVGCLPILPCFSSPPPGPLSMTPNTPLNTESLDPTSGLRGPHRLHSGCCTKLPRAGRLKHKHVFLSRHRGQQVLPNLFL